MKVTVSGIGRMFPQCLHAHTRQREQFQHSHFCKLVRGVYVELQIVTQMDLTLFLIAAFQNHPCKCIYWSWSNSMFFNGNIGKMLVGKSFTGSSSQTILTWLVSKFPFGQSSLAFRDTALSPQVRGIICFTLQINRLHFELRILILSSIYPPWYGVDWSL